MGKKGKKATGVLSALCYEIGGKKGSSERYHDAGERKSKNPLRVAWPESTIVGMST